MSSTKASKTNQKKQVVLTDLPTINPNNSISEYSITTQKYNTLTSNRNVSNHPSKKTSNLQLTKPSKHPINPKEEIVIPNINKTQLRVEELPHQQSESSNDQTDFQRNEQTTLDLLDKIRQSTNAEAIGPMPLSLQACRFQLPFDLKLLESLTPLNYLSKYCCLSSRRQYQFKRLFDKYRNRNYHFESSYLYLSLLDIHKHHLTYQLFHYLCQLIELDHEQYQFTFNIYAGILALCERILYRSSILYADDDDYNLTKDVIEKCDFYSLDRKLDGLIISDSMKRLLNAL